MKLPDMVTELEQMTPAERMTTAKNLFTYKSAAMNRLINAVREEHDPAAIAKLKALQDRVRVLPVK